MTYKCRWSTIPCSITSCFKCCSKSTWRERRRIWLSLNQFFTRKTHQYFAVFLWSCDKSIMLFCSYSCQRLKPVAVMCCTFLDCPFFHLMSNDICYFQRKFLSLFYRLFQLFVYFFRKSFFHDSVIEYITSEKFGYIHVVWHLLSPLVYALLYVSQFWSYDHSLVLVLFK